MSGDLLPRTRADRRFGPSQRPHRRPPARPAFSSWSNEYSVEGQKSQTRKFSHKDFKRDSTDFLKTFQEYYGRHSAAKEYLPQKASASRASGA